jgi:hypothetical protein
MDSISENELAAYRLEVVALQMSYDEKLLTGLRHVLLGQLDEARELLFDLAHIERDLTYIKSCLQDKYKQVATLH